MANKRISEDELSWTLDVKSSEAQKEVHKLEVQLSQLNDESRRYRNELTRMEAAGRKNTEEYKRIRSEYSAVTKKVGEMKAEINKATKAIKVEDMTMRQLRNQAKQLRAQLDNTSKALNPKRYDQLADRLTAVNARMNDLKITAKGVKETVTDKGMFDVFMGTALTSFAEFMGKNLAVMKDYMQESVRMAEATDGVSKAFRELDRPDLLDNLRKATKGTVTDMELMKAAVQAKDFRIPLEDLGKYLQFAQLKAQQTGQSVEYMTNSIVTGLGRKSNMILDNLGISAAEIDEKMQETGDFTKAVASIVENQLAAAGKTYVSAADRAMQKTVALQNAQLELGQALLPLKEKVDDVFGFMKISLMEVAVWLLKHKEITTALTVATIGFAVAMARANVQLKAWAANTILAKAATTAWGVAVGTAKGIVLMFAAAKATLTGNTLRAAAAMRLFNATCKANVIIAVATAVIALGVALVAYMSKNKAAAKSAIDLTKTYTKVTSDIKRQNEELSKDANAKVADEITRIKQLRKTINDTNASYTQRRAAIAELQKIVPGYHATLNGEGNLYKANSKAIDDYIGKLRQAAMAEAAYEKMKENNKKILDAQDRKEDSEKKIRYVKQNTKNKYGFDFDEQSMGGGNTVWYNKERDVEIGGGIKGTKKTKYAGFIKDDQDAANIKANQDFIKAKEQLVKRDEIIVSKYEEQNKRLENIIVKNGGRNTSMLQSKFNNSGATSSGHTPKTTTTTPKEDPDKELKAQFEAEREMELTQRKAMYDQSITLLKQHLAEKKITKEQYDIQAAAQETAYTKDILAIETAYTEKAQNLAIEDAQKKQSIISTQQANEQRALEDYNQRTLEEMQDYYAMLDEMQQAGTSDEQRKEAEYQAQLEALEAYHKASLEYAHKYGQDETEVESSYMQAKLKLFLDYQAAAEAAAKEHEQRRKGILGQYGLLSDKEQLDMELEQLKEHLDQKMLTEEEYAKAETALKRDAWKRQFDYYSGLFSDAFNALQDAEMANVDAKYDAEIEAARQAGEDTTELENKKAAEKLAIEKKYADVNFAVKASQIIADTSVSIMKALAELGPIAGPIAAALMGVTGAAQLAVANAEREKVKKMTLGSGGSSSSSGGARVATGLAGGGRIDVEREQDGKHFNAEYDPTRRGYVEHPTVIVGEGPMGQSREWVASNAALSNPTVAPIIDLIDKAQQAGTVRTLDMRKLMVKQVVGRETGGAIVTTPPSSLPTQHSPLHTQNSTLPAQTLIDLTAAIKELNDKGVRSYVALDDFDAQQQRRAQARKIGSKI